MASLKRLPVEATLYKVKQRPRDDLFWSEDPEMLYRVASTRITRVMSSLRASVAQNGQFDYGICRVWYNKSPRYWNEFRFTSVEELYRVWLEDTEPVMLRAFAKDGTLDKRYLSKRKMTAKQLAAAKRNAKKLTTYRFKKEN